MNTIETTQKEKSKWPKRIFIIFLIGHKETEQVMNILNLFH